MSGNTWLISPGSPASVSVHYQRYVRGESIGVDLTEEELIYGTAFNYVLKLSKDISAHYFYEVMSECDEQRRLLGTRQFNSPHEPKSTRWQALKDQRLPDRSSRVLLSDWPPFAYRDPLQ